MSREKYPLYSLQGDLLSLLRDWPDSEFPNKRQKVKNIYDNLVNYLEKRYDYSPEKDLGQKKNKMLN